MGKKLLWLLVIAVLLLVGAWIIYYRIARTIPQIPAAATNWPPSSPGDAPSNSKPVENPPSAAASRGDASVKGGPAAASLVFTLRQGETLEYDANITKLNSTVAHLKIAVVEKRERCDKATWHLQAFAHTENPYRMVFELDDQFDSYSDAVNMASVQYEMHLNERGQKVDTVERMLPSPKDVPPPGVSAARVLPGTRDPLGMLHYLRSVDWSQTREVRSPVYDGRKLYEARAILVGKSAPVSVPAGKFNTTKIEIHVLDNGAEMKDARFLLYLTNDAQRLPVLMEAVLPVATASVQLTKSK